MLTPVARRRTLGGVSVAAHVVGSVLALGAALAGCHGARGIAPTAPPAVASADAAPRAPASIGSATMLANGTLVLDLRAEDGNGSVGDARLFYPPSHAQYAEILAHVGPLHPGESRPVPPWPDDAGATR